MMFSSMSNQQEVLRLDDNRIRLQVDDLMSYFSSIKNSFATTVLKEAVSFAKDHNGMWKFWTCCHCNDKFDHPELHRKHVVDMHLSKLSPEHRSVVPVPVCSDWFSMICSETWKPIDTTAALKLLQHQYELLRSKPNEAFNITAIDESSELQSSLVVEPLMSSLEKCLHKMKRARKYYLAQNWPLSDDSVREKILWKISKLFKFLLVSDSLTQSHLNKVISYTMEEFKRLVPSLDVKLLCLDQTHLCICFLEASQLQLIEEFLTDLNQSSSAHLLSDDNKININDMLNPSTLGVEIKETFVLNGNLLSIFLHKEDSLTSDRGTPADSDVLSRWFLTGQSCEEELESWRRLEKDRTIQGNELNQTFMKYFHTLESLAEKKCNQLGYKKGLEFIWDCYLDELSKRRRATNHVSRSLKEILTEIEKDPSCVRQLSAWLLLSHMNLNNDLKSRFRFQSEDSHIMTAISNVLKGHQPINVTPEKSLIGSTTGICFSKYLPEDYFQAVLIQADNCIVEAVQRESKNNDFKLLENDARILQTFADMQKLVLGMKSSAVADFQAVLLPLVKSYMQAHMEGRADKGVTLESVTAKVATSAHHSAKTIDGNEQCPGHKRPAGKWLVSCSTTKVSRLWENSTRQ